MFCFYEVLLLFCAFLALLFRIRVSIFSQPHNLLLNTFFGLHFALLPKSFALLAPTALVILVAVLIANCRALFNVRCENL